MNKVNIEALKEKIKASNLSNEEISHLIDLLEKEKLDIKYFNDTFLKTLSLGKDLLKLFDIDIGE